VRERKRGGGQGLAAASPALPAAAPPAQAGGRSGNGRESGREGEEESEERERGEDFKEGGKAVERRWGRSRWNMEEGKEKEKKRKSI